MKNLNSKFFNHYSAERRSRSGGQAMIIAVILFLSLALIAVFGIVNPVIRHMIATRSILHSKQGFYLAESGVEDVIYRLQNGLVVGSSQTLTLAGNSVTTTAVDELGGKKIVATGNFENFIRKTETHLTLGTGISFHYGIQAGRGGFVLQNSASVVGNIYSGGAVVGAGNYIYGDVISSGPTGLVYGVHATGTIYSHTIGNSSQATFADKDIFYVTKTGTVTVGGDQYAPANDPPDVPLPITDAQIAEWEADAEAGGTISGESCAGGTYQVTSNITIGPKKIDCNLLIKGNGVQFIMSGPVWVVGNITTQTGPIIKISPSLGNQNVALIADNPADPRGSGIITIGQNTQFFGSGSPNSFVFSISQNTDAENGGTTNAVDMGQSAGALVAYANHGQITLGQSVGVKEATAYKIVLTNTANVTYDTGLPSTLFQAGPSGGYDLAKWREVE